MQPAERAEAAAAPEADGSDSEAPGESSSGGPALQQPEPPVPWSGSTFTLTIDDDRWTQPQGLGADFGLFVPTFLIGIDETRQQAWLTTIDDGEQSSCTPTTATPLAATGASDFRLGPIDLPIHLVGYDDVRVNAIAYGFTLTNALPTDDSPGSGTLHTTMDTRDLYPMFTILQAESADDVCAVLVSAGVPCEPCPSDGEAYCTVVEAQGLGATVSNSTLTQNPPSQIGAECVGANEL
jgi:hypothetical protein